jgi:hypothetical protein
MLPKINSISEAWTKEMDKGNIHRARRRKGIAAQYSGTVSEKMN